MQWLNVPTAIDPFTIYDRGWIFRIRPANTSAPRQIDLMIHGWTGNERSMEVFSHGLPQEDLLLFPRGPVQSPDGGYGWSVVLSETLTSLEDFKHSANSLIEEVDWRIKEITGNTFAQFNIIGFSQGAALAYTITLLHPHRIRKLAALAGFLPAFSLGYQPPLLSGLPVFVAHGKNDKTIPIDRAREAVSFLKAAGADIVYCESESGHKLPANCFNALTQFLTR
jgi:phospholipase/carboxylesterase